MPKPEFARPESCARRLKIRVSLKLLSSIPCFAPPPAQLLYKRSHSTRSGPAAEKFGLLFCEPSISHWLAPLHSATKCRPCCCANSLPVRVCQTQSNDNFCVNRMRKRDVAWEILPAYRPESQNPGPIRPGLVREKRNDGKSRASHSGKIESRPGRKEIRRQEIGR